MPSRSWLIVLCLLTASAAAQPYGQGFVVPGYKHLHHVTPSGAVTSVTFTTGNVYTATMDLHNKTALVYDFTRGAILNVDPRTLAVVGTFFTDAALNGAGAVYGMDFDANGDLYFSGGYPVRGVYRVDQGGNLVTVKKAANGGAPFGWTREMFVDIDSGDLIVSDTLTTLSQPLYQLKRDGSSFTTLARNFDFRYGTQRHVLTGDIYSGSCCFGVGPTGKSMLVLKGNATSPTTFLNDGNLRGAYGPRFDRASAATQRIITGAWNYSAANPTASGIWYVTMNGLVTTQIAPIQTGNTYEALPVFGRNLQGVSTGKGKWDLRMSFPGRGGKGYVLALGASGVRPVTKLADGRSVPLALDALSALSLSGQLAPILQNNIGKLSAPGEAVATLDVSGFGPALNGTLIWAVVAVTGPAAPVGLDVIADPKVLVIEGL